MENSAFQDVDDVATDCESPEKITSEDPNGQDSFKEPCNGITNTTTPSSDHSNNCDATSNNCITPVTNNTLTPDMDQMGSNSRINQVDSTDNMMDAPELHRKRQAAGSTKLGMTSDRPAPRCRRNLFGSDETAAVGGNGSDILVEVTSCPTTSSQSEELEVLEEEESVEELSLQRAEMMSDNPLICLPVMYTSGKYNHSSTNTFDSDNSGDDFSDDEDSSGKESSDEECTTTNYTFDEDYSDLVSGVKFQRRRVARAVFIVIKRQLLVFRPDALNQSVSLTDIFDTNCERDLSEGDDSEAEYDQPRLRPEDYVRPRRQRRFPSHRNQTNEGPSIRRRLVFDNHEEGSTSQKMMSKYKMHVPVSCVANRVQPMFTSPESQPTRPSVRRRLFDDDNVIENVDDLMQHRRNESRPSNTMGRQCEHSSCFSRRSLPSDESSTHSRRMHTFSRISHNAQSFTQSNDFSGSPSHIDQSSSPSRDIDQFFSPPSHIDQSSDPSSNIEQFSTPPNHIDQSSNPSNHVDQFSSPSSHIDQFSSPSSHIDQTCTQSNDTVFSGQQTLADSPSQSNHTDLSTQPSQSDVSSPSSHACVSIQSNHTDLSTQPSQSDVFSLSSHACVSIQSNHNDESSRLSLYSAHSSQHANSKSPRQR